MLDSLRSRLSRPEYTGENRCWPCTVVNAVVVLAVSVLVGVVALPLGALVLGVGAVLILLRGYVVPYTPTFAPKLVAALPLPDGVFGKEETDIPETESLTATELDGEAVLGALAEAGVIEADGELVRPTAAVGIQVSHNLVVKHGVSQIEPACNLFVI